jgi:hypothetical protein
MLRSVRAIPEGKVRAIFEEIAPDKMKAILDRHGSFQKLLTEAGNRLQRNAARNARTGANTNPLMAAMNGSFRIWQHTPGLSSVSSGTHRFTKFLYPMLRFGLDPFYKLMNVIEPDIYGVTNAGRKGARFGRRVAPQEQSSRAAELSSVTSVPPGGITSKDLPSDLLLADPGVYTTPRNIRPILEREFDVQRLDSTEAFLRALPKQHPIAQIMVERWGDNVKDWAAEFDRIMYGWVTKGPEQTIKAEAKKVMTQELGMSLEEARTMIPAIERLGQQHRGQYNDLIQLYVGRMNRGNAERLLDHFFFFWPLSYQIKATAWMYRIMFDKIGGVRTGAAGAYLWNEYRQRWDDEVERDPGLRRFLDDNEDFMFAFEMMFPMTPSGVGTSLSRPTRYTAGWLASEMEMPPDMFGEYENINTIDDVFLNSTRVGPARTYGLFQRVMEGFEVPGFVEQGEPAAPVTLPK